MPTVYVPGVARSVLKGMIGANPWVVVHHWKFGTVIAPWIQADTDALALNIFNSWGTHMKADTGGNTSVNEVDVVDLTNATGVGSTYTHTPVNGTQGAIIEPSSACVNVQNRIASRYRGGHPRTMWPCLTTQDMLNEYQWSPTRLTAIGNDVAAFVGTVAAATYSGGAGTLQHVIPRYTYTYTNDSVHHKYLKERTGLEGVHTVMSYFAVQRIGQMRRRLVP